MNLTTYIPTDELLFGVRLIRLVERTSAFNVTFFPTGYPFIVSNVDRGINITKNEKENSAFTFLCGLTNRPFNMALLRAERVIIIQLQPWILSRMFPFSAHVFLNHEVPLIDVDREFTLRLEDLVSECKNGEELIKGIKNLLFSKIAFNQLDKRILFAWRMMLANKGNVRIKELANYVNLGNRRLEQLFKAHIGYSPKNYEGIIRVQSAIFEHIVKGHERLETPTGYYDQAHFIHDVKTYSGMTPTSLTEYLKNPIQKVTSLDSNIYHSSIIH